MTPPRYVVATSGAGSWFEAIIYRRQNGDARTDEFVEKHSGFRDRTAARAWGRKRIVELGEPS